MTEARKVSAAVKIQARARGMRVRRWYRHVHEIIQQARREAMAAVCIQKRARGHLAHKAFCGLRRAVMALQLSFRQHRAKHATVLQRQTRGLIHRRRFLRTLQAAITVQRMSRGFHARRHLRRALFSLRLLQRWYRVMSHRRRSLVKIQAFARGASARHAYIRAVMSARHIQSWYRSERERVNQPDTVQSWDVILKWTHVYQSRQKYAPIIRAVRAVQLRFRARHDAKVIRVQAWWRGVLARRKARRVLRETRRRQVRVVSIQFNAVRVIMPQNHRTREASSGHTMALQLMTRQPIDLPSPPSRSQFMEDKASTIQRVWRGTVARGVARGIQAEQALAKVGLRHSKRPFSGLS